MAQGANLAPDASANAVDEQLGTLCRRWLTCAENVVRAYERHGAQGSASADLLRLYQQGLQDACSAFIEFSESTSWHLAPEPSHADNAFTSQVRIALLDCTFCTTRSEGRTAIEQFLQYPRQASCVVCVRDAVSRRRVLCPQTPGGRLSTQACCVRPPVRSSACACRTSRQD